MPKAVKKKKKFIDKKESTTFHLIPGYVEDEVLSTKDDIPSDPDARKEQQREYGIFFNDDYNYMKHLRSVEEEATLVNVESFHVGPDDETRSHYSRASGMPVAFREFFSTDETEEEKIDADILAALDDAPEVKVDGEEVVEDGDDFLDDDFVVAAGGMAPMPVKDEDDEEDLESDDREFDFDDEEEEEDSDDSCIGSDGDFGSDTEDRLHDLEARQGRGNTQDDIAEAQTALILKNFEEGLGFRCSVQQEEDDDEMPTPEDYENLKRILNQDKFSDKPVSLIEVLDDKTDRPKIDAKKYIYDDVDEFEWKDAPPSKPKFDCVSILSLNSNTRNLPTDLVPPKKEGKSKQKLSSVSEASETNVRPGLTLQQLEAEMRESRRADRASTFRPKDETVDEKKMRKKAIKEERKERRQEKKANKEVFALEKEKMKKETVALSKAVKGVNIT